MAGHRRSCMDLSPVTADQSASIFEVSGFEKRIPHVDNGARP